MSSENKIDLRDALEESPQVFVSIDCDNLLSSSRIFSPCVETSRFLCASDIVAEKMAACICRRDPNLHNFDSKRVPAAWCLQNSLAIKF